MGVIAPQSFIKSEVRQMDRNRKKHKFSLPVTVTVGIALALVFYLALSYFLGGYRSDIYDRIIDSNISALKETTSTLISKTTVTRKPLPIAKKATLVFLFFEKAAYMSVGKI